MRFKLFVSIFFATVTVATVADDNTPHRYAVASVAVATADFPDVLYVNGGEIGFEEGSSNSIILYDRVKDGTTLWIGSKQVDRAALLAWLPAVKHVVVDVTYRRPVGTARTAVFSGER